MPPVFSSPVSARSAAVALLFSCSALVSLVRAQPPSPAAEPPPLSPVAPVAAASPRRAPAVRALKVTVLSTMLADAAGVGEWGFAALVEADDDRGAHHRLLFDTGARPDTVLRNARELRVDLTDVGEVVLSHHHWDHVGGLVTLRRELSAANPGALGRAYVGAGIFAERVIPPDVRGAGQTTMAEVRSAYEALGGRFVTVERPTELFPGATLTGPVPRPYPERNWSAGVRRRSADGRLVEDDLPEDQALVLDAPGGLVVLTGCGHAGIVNILEYARQAVRPGPVQAALGGFHLFAASPEALAWTADQLRGFGVSTLLGAHCTGLEPVYFFRQRLGLPRAACVVGAVGSTYELGKGITPGNLAR